MNRKRTGRLAAVSVAAVTAFASLLPGVAYAGGGAGSSDGGGSAPMAVSQQWAYRDDNDGGFGGYSMDSVLSAFGAMGVTMAGGEAEARKALDEANANCVARYNEAHPGEGTADCRVVGVGTMTGPNKRFSGQVHHLKADWLNNWMAQVGSGVYSNNGVRYQTNTPFQDQPGTSVDSLVDAYTSDSTTIVVIMLNKWEPVADVPPAPPSKSVEPGVSADGMVNHTVISSGTGSNGREFAFSDTFDPHGQSYTVSNQRVVDATTGQDVSDRFVFDTPDGATPAGNVAHATWKGGALPDGHTFEWRLDVTVHAPSTSKVDDRGHTYWKGASRSADQDTPSREFPTWRPSPDKSWVRQDASGRWLAVVDPSHSNATGADNMKFLDGDRVAGVVNGTVDAHLIDAPSRFALTDDWAKAAYLVRPAKAEDVRVYEADAAPGPDGHYERSSVDGIVTAGRDVTSMFDVTIVGTKAVAVAKPAYLAALRNRATPLQVTLLVPMTVDFAHGKGAEQARKDHGARPGDELTFCTDASGRELTNAGSQTVNGQETPTNEPKICGYVPPVKKDVVSESSQGGDQSSVDGKVVHPGQKVEYQLDTQPHLPADLAYEVKSVSFTDQYDKYLEADEQTLEIMDLDVGRSIGKSKYDTHWDDARHSVRIDINDRALLAQWRAGGAPRLQLRFEGRVRVDAPTDHFVENRWMLEINNSLTSSNIVSNRPADFHPVKRDNKTREEGGAAVSIDGRTLVVGDTGEYELELDAKQSNMAYNVWRLGMIDDVDDEYLRIDAGKVKVIGDDNRDYSTWFNIGQVRGVFYIFAKTVDTFIPATGQTVRGDPQPADLAKYARLKQTDHDPLHDPAIDQRLLGHTYRIVLPYLVIKSAPGHVARNTVTQVVNGQSRVSNEVNNPISELKPHKDVVEQIGAPSIDGGKVGLNQRFLYRLDSSILPAKRAYPQVSEWSIHDHYDRSVDEYTKVWSVVAARPLLGAGGVILAKAGQPIAGNGFDSSAFGGDLFVIEDSDADGLRIKATTRYLELVSVQGECEQAWTAYVQFERIASADEVRNQFTETINSVGRVSNVVRTSTPSKTVERAVEPPPSEQLPQSGSSVVVPLVVVATALVGAGGMLAWRRVRCRSVVRKQ